ncbi:MAG: MarR family transcriptional regulator [Armatimonadota bacterium]|nr:MarR family transcriptional regulator [bacterium]
MSLEQSGIVRDSTEYAEILAEAFVEVVQKAAKDAMCCEFASDEITPALMECLQYVYLHGASPIREIALGLEISVSAGSQLVDRLVKKDLVTRRENQEDRRLIVVELTDAGRELVKQMRKRRSSWFESVVNALPEPKRRALLEGLEGFLEVSLSREDKIDRACVKCGMEHVSFCVINKLKDERTSAR